MAAVAGQYPRYRPHHGLIQPHRCVEAAADVEEIAVFAVPRRVLGAGKEEALAAGPRVLAVILEEALRNLLIVRIVADAGGDQCQAMGEIRAGSATLEIGLGPADALLA